MSLINDALKRASQTQKQPPAVTNAPAVPDTPATPHSAAAPAMQAAETKSRSGSPMIVPIMIAVAAVVLLVGVVLGWMLLGKKETFVVQNVPVAPAAPVAPKVEATPTPPPAPVPTVSVAEKPVPTPTKVEAIVAAPVVETKTTANPEAKPTAAVAETVAITPAATPAPVPPPVPTFPAIKLQGIFYRKSNPTALLNGNNLEVGQKLDGVTLSKIAPTSVTLEWNGETKVLELR